MKYISELLNKKIEIASPPSDLCLKCGRCCKMIVSEHSEAKLLELAKNNDAGAKIFLDMFKPYSSHEKIKDIDEQHFTSIIQKFKKKNINEKDVTFYYCPYVTDENLCKIYSRRPICCKRAPVTGWAMFPDGCGYLGWQFQQREIIKEHVRKLKEVLYELEMLYPAEKTDIQQIKQKIQNKLSEYEKYGAKNW